MKQHIKEGMPNINELLSDYNISMNLRTFTSTENLIGLPLKAKLFSAKTLTNLVSYTKYTQKRYSYSTFHFSLLKILSSYFNFEILLRNKSSRFSFS